MLWYVSGRLHLSSIIQMLCSVIQSYPLGGRNGCEGAYWVQAFMTADGDDGKAGGGCGPESGQTGKENRQSRQVEK